MPTTWWFDNQPVTGWYANAPTSASIYYIYNPATSAYESKAVSSVNPIFTWTTSSVYYSVFTKNGIQDGDKPYTEYTFINPQQYFPLNSHPNSAYNGTWSGDGIYYGYSNQLMIRQIEYVSRDKSVEIGVEKHNLFAWVKTGTRVSTPAATATSFMIGVKTFNDTFNSLRYDKWEYRILGAYSINNNKLRITNVGLNQSENEYDVQSLVEFNSNFEIEITISIPTLNSTTVGGLTFTPASASEVMSHTLAVGKDMFAVYYNNGNIVYGNISVTGAMNTYPASMLTYYDLKVNCIKNTRTFTLSIRVSGDTNWIQLTPVVLGSSFNYNPKMDMCLYNAQPNEYIEFANYKINSGTYLYVD